MIKASDLLGSLAVGCGCLVWFVSVLILTWVLLTVVFPQVSSDLIWRVLLGT